MLSGQLPSMAFEYLKDSELYQKKKKFFFTKVSFEIWITLPLVNTVYMLLFRSTSGYYTNT